MKRTFDPRAIFQANVDRRMRGLDELPQAKFCFDDESYPEVDALVERLRAVRENLRGSTVVFVKNKARFDEIMQAADDLAQLIFECDDNAEINVSPDELIGNSIVVDVAAQVISVCDVARFGKILASANSFDAYARTDGKVVLIVGFDGGYDIAGAFKDSPRLNAAGVDRLTL